MGMKRIAIFFADTYEKELACYKALAGQASDANFEIDDFVLIPGTRMPERGFYIFKAHTSYFCPFPKEVSRTEPEAAYYDLEMNSRREPRQWMQQ
jgi:hypothetical protein